MKVAIIGGTGKMGLALGKQLAKKNEVIIASRDPERARGAAKGIPGATGTDYHTACKEGGVILFSIPYSAISSAAELAEDAAGKLVISLVNPLVKEGGILRYPVQKGSAAEELAKLLPKSRVATAFNNVPRSFFEREVSSPFDILVAADAKETYEEAAALVRTIEGLRPLYAGPLDQARIIEETTALVLNLASLNGTGVLTTGFVSRKS